MVAVAYKRWSFTRGSNCKALAGKILEFWLDSHLWHTEVQVYLKAVSPQSRIKYLIAISARGHLLVLFIYHSTVTCILTCTCEL